MFSQDFKEWLQRRREERKKHKVKPQKTPPSPEPCVESAKPCTPRDFLYMYLTDVFNKQNLDVPYAIERWVYEEDD